MPFGRPLKYNNCLDLDMDCEMYFDSCFYKVDEWGELTDEKREIPEPLTITGLALALHTSRETLMNYEKREDYFDTIKRHKLRIENSYEKALRRSGKAGDIFGLKNFGWKDKSEVNQNLKVASKIKISHTNEEE